MRKAKCGHQGDLRYIISELVPSSYRRPDGSFSCPTKDLHYRLEKMGITIVPYNRELGYDQVASRCEICGVLYGKPRLSDGAWVDYCDPVKHKEYYDSIEEVPCDSYSGS